MYPALALGREFTNRGYKVITVTDSRGAKLIANQGVEYITVPSTAFFGKSIADKFKAIIAYAKGKKDCKKLIDKFNPTAIIGAGGYASLPLLQAGKAKKIPYFLLEQNSVPGRVTRLTAKGAKMIFTGIPLVKKIKGKVIFTGNVLRKSIIVTRKYPKEILVLGGSGGAKTLNRLAYKLASKMTTERFIVLTGKRDFKEMSALPKLENLELIEYTQHPERLYRRAKLAISRSGAIALSELMANGIPSIVIPFPYAIDNHQYHNARWAANKGAVILVNEDELENLNKKLSTLIKDRAKMQQMSKAAKNLVSENAAEEIVERIEKCLAG